MKAWKYILIAGSVATVSEPAFSQCLPSSPCVTTPTSLGVDGYSEVLVVNDDGSVVGAVSSVPSLAGNNGNYLPPGHAFSWTRATGWVDLGSLGSYFIATALTGDGSVVVGASYDGNVYGRAARWTSGTGMTDLGTLTGRYSSGSTATAVSRNGSVVVGNSFFSNPGSFGIDSYSHAFRWTSATGMVDLGTLDGDYLSSSTATAVSSDGLVVVGSSNGNAFRWKSATGMVSLDTWSGRFSSATAVSSDGSVVVGRIINDFFTGNAFRWSSATGMVDLGTLGALGENMLGTFFGKNPIGSEATAVSGDGSVVVGYSYSFGNPADKFGNGFYIHPFRWTSASGMRDLNTLLASAGVDMSGISLSTATAISTNGQFILGRGLFLGIDRSYVVRYFDGFSGLVTTDGIQRSGTICQSRDLV